MLAYRIFKRKHFVKVINKVKISCKLSGVNVEDHFLVKRKIVKFGTTTKEVIDYKLLKEEQTL